MLSEAGELVHYTPLKKTIPEIPKPAEAAKAPSEIMTNEELYLTGLHLEQYRHATLRPDDYYLEGLKRDAGDIRINTAYGSLLMRRGLFKEAEKHFRQAIKRLTWKNPNPYDSEAYYDLGLSLLYQKRDSKAFEAFFKASWSAEQQEMSFYYLAAIEAKRRHFSDALQLVDKALVKNAHNVKARGLKLYLLRKLNLREEAVDLVRENLGIDPFDYVTRMEDSYLCEESEDSYSEDKKGLSPDDKRKKLVKLARNYHENFLNAARDYEEFGAYKEALDVLDLCTESWAMLQYERAYIVSSMGDTEEARLLYRKAKEASTDYVFPNKLEDIAVLEDALRYDPSDGTACYYLGNLYYDKTVYDKAISYWEAASQNRPDFATVWRNLSIAYYNKLHDPERSKSAMDKAYALAPEDPRIFLEYDQLLKKLNVSPEDRLRLYEENREVFSQRDDLKVEYVTLLNLLGEYKKALDFIKVNRFHPWEGGEGKITTQYVYALTGLALKEMKSENWKEAGDLLRDALCYPENLGEGKLEGTKDNNINYYLGLCEEHLSKEAEAQNLFSEASVGTDEPAGMMYYNDQPADMIYFEGLALKKLGKEVSGKSHFNKLIDYGERHMRDEVNVGYFAVSLPDFQIFDEDWTRRNQAHCHYLMGLGKLGYGEISEAGEEFRKAIELEPTHWNAIRYLRIAEDKL